MHNFLLKKLFMCTNGGIYLKVYTKVDGCQCLNFLDYWLALNMKPPKVIDVLHGEYWVLIRCICQIFISKSTALAKKSPSNVDSWIWKQLITADQVKLG